MTIVESSQASPHLVMGWTDDPRTTPLQVTHAAEFRHRVAVCGARLAYLGGDWSGLTRFGRCSVCRLAATEIWGEVETGDPKRTDAAPHRI